MKICAIICEYNPFHNGHLYQLNEASKRFDETICLMSGNFVQRAEPAIVEKNLRAKMALNCGASAVVELPLPYAVSNGERFAYGAIKTLSTFSDITSLVMGAETDNEKLLRTLADIQAEENETFKEILSSSLSNGETYASALTHATVTIAKEHGYDENEATEILQKPNNLLCIEYIKALKRLMPSCSPVIIKRVGNDYNDKKITGAFSSATAIREAISRNDFTPVQSCVPYADELIDAIELNPVSLYAFSKIALLTLREKSTEEIASVYDCREGLEFKLKENAYKYNNLSALLNAVKSKRYTLSRLKRLVLSVMLGIDTQLVTTEDFLPPRLLAIKETFKSYLAGNGKNMIIRTEDFENFTSETQLKFFACEKKASDLYSVLSGINENLFIPKKLYTI